MSNIIGMTLTIMFTIGMVMLMLNMLDQYLYFNQFFMSLVEVKGTFQVPLGRINKERYNMSVQEYIEEAIRHLMLKNPEMTEAEARTYVMFTIGG